MTELISDKQKFGQLKEDSSLQRQRALQRTLRKINKEKIFNGFEPTWLYGTPKIHKAFLPSSVLPFWPIVSSIGTYN